MLKNLINKMIRQGKLSIIDRHNVNEFKKDLEQEAQLYILTGFEPEEAIKKAHYKMLPKRYTINKKRKRIKPIPYGLNIDSKDNIKNDDELFVDEIVLRNSLQALLSKDEYKIVELKRQSREGYKTNGYNNEEIAETLGKSRQYVQYKLKEIQRKLRKYL